MISSALGTGYDGHGQKDGKVAETLVRTLLVAARAAQSRWSAVTIGERLMVVRTFRQLFAERARSLCGMLARLQFRPEKEVLTAEIFPLIAAFRFLEREAAKLLAPRRLGKRGLPLWLRGIAAEVQRD